MIEFNEYLEVMDEALITFGKKKYPKFGQIVILAGGAGSGKGFVLKKLLGIEGKVLDVDKLKEMVIASKKLSTLIAKETGQDIKKMDLKNPANVTLMHKLINDVYGIAGKNQKQMLKSVSLADESRKPNIIFDVTLKDKKKLKTISDSALSLGYDKRNIHIVWVVNDVKVAIKQNSERERVVPLEILIGTHVGAAQTMNSILSSGDDLKQYMDGDIWLAFNKKGVDVSKKSITKHGKDYIIETPSFPFKVKEQGKLQMKLKDIGKDLYAKVKSYVPAKTDL